MADGPAQGRLWAALLKLLVWLGLAALIGLLFGRPWMVLVIALAALLLWHSYRLLRMSEWLKGGARSEPPDYGGLWGEAFGHAARLFRRKEYYKQRLQGLSRELRESTAAMPDGVIVLNAACEIMWFNPNAERLLGLRARRDEGMRIDNLVRQPAFVQYLRGSDHATPVTVRGSGPQEEYLRLQLVSYGEGQQLLLVRDVTRSVLLEAMRKDFVANASHELRSPLTVISGYLEALVGDSTLPEDLRTPIGEMQRQAQRMNAIVADLLELSRLEASDRRAGSEPVAVVALLAELERDVLAAGTHPALHLQIESARGLLGNRAELRSAFGNLIHNAVKYTPATGSVTVRWWTDAEGGHLSVTDTGIGIPAEHLPRLTERFYRVDPGRSRETGGSGLGLAIVKHVMQQHGGQLEISSVEGQGSVFTCNFPGARILAVDG